MKRKYVPVLSTTSIRPMALGVGSALLLAVAGCNGQGAAPGPSVQGEEQGFDGLLPAQRKEVLAAVGTDADPRTLEQAAELVKLGQTADQIRATLRNMPTALTAPAPQARVRNGERIPESEILRGHADSGNNR